MKVLVVDNDRDTAETLAMLRAHAQCDVRVAYNGPAGLDEATKFEPDLLLADLGLGRAQIVTTSRREMCAIKWFDATTGIGAARVQTTIEAGSRPSERQRPAHSRHR